MKTSAYEYFREITAIPRPSKKEERVRGYLIDWANLKGFENKVDATGNLFVYVPATADKLDSESVILQAHMDMVCVKTEESNHDFEKDALEIYEEDGFLKAKDTTLWADNGVWIALIMTAIDFGSHPAMELVFTVDEEMWMSWVLSLDFGFLKSKKVLNLDTEDENEICISSAWWARISLNKALVMKKPASDQFKIEIFWMKWWHSWVDIDKNHSNAIKFFLDFIARCEAWLELASIKWWTADNVIPSSVSAVIWIEDIWLFFKELTKAIDAHKQEYDCPDIGFSIDDQGKKSDVLENWKDMVKPISSVKVWVYSMSAKIPWLVQTSMNLWMIDIWFDSAKITYLPRSSDMNEFGNLLSQIGIHFENSGFGFEIHSRYPGWQDDPLWELVKVATQEIAKQIWKEPHIIAVHAWLECGALVAWLWEWAHAISIWPSMFDVHSVNERVKIDSISKMERALEGILGKL
ncbi:MAG: hypothetical protein ACD_2C00088G0008 [uncultured bacterium (gcode 4)]|uniref:Aminoacyl-histidine dipeptidase n=1 Tax=uncultured bacterium (gcode 4) TaxID=1234023 RepID=K2G3L9_9BACT|nr:MAG: hypothetical protein ACD_2C00088G0008 [uncultured bacterium (gcode 4)]